MCQNQIVFFLFDLFLSNNVENIVGFIMVVYFDTKKTCVEIKSSVRLY
jgi:hypothetical protein